MSNLGKRMEHLSTTEEIQIDSYISAINRLIGSLIILKITPNGSWINYFDKRKWVLRYLYARQHD